MGIGELEEQKQSGVNGTQARGLFASVDGATGRKLFAIAIPPPCFPVCGEGGRRVFMFPDCRNVAGHSGGELRAAVESVALEPIDYGGRNPGRFVGGGNHNHVAELGELALQAVFEQDPRGLREQFQFLDNEDVPPVRRAEAEGAFRSEPMADGIRVQVRAANGVGSLENIVLASELPGDCLGGRALARARGAGEKQATGARIGNDSGQGSYGRLTDNLFEQARPILFFVVVHCLVSFVSKGWGGCYGS